MSDKLMELAGRDRPIIFSTPMVRALLDGRKTQTRRALKSGKRPAMILDGGGVLLDWSLSPPRQRVGDRLWVREACWIAPPYWTDSPVNPMGPHRQETAYAADDRSGYTRDAAADYKLKLRPSIHMPRWASRLTLLVDDVRIERLQDISEGDAVAEGVTLVEEALEDPVDAYHVLWDSINGPGSWETNPWVAAITFRVFRQNIDLISRGGAE